MPIGLDAQWHDVLCMNDMRCRSAYTSCIIPVNFGQPSPDSIEFGESATATLDRQAGLLQQLKQRPTGRIDGSGIFQGSFGLGQDLCQDFGLLPKRGRGP